MGNGFKETAFINTDEKKFKENHGKIFGERISIDCEKCDLSSKQKSGEEFTCPHCGESNGLNK